MLNNIVTLARGVLCFYCLSDLLGILWFGWSFGINEYLVLIITLLVSASVIYLSSPDILELDRKLDDVIIIFGMMLLLFSMAANWLDFIDTPSLSGLFLTFIPVITIYGVKIIKRMQKL